MGFKNFSNIILLLFCFSCSSDFPVECEECGFNCLKGDEKKVENNNCQWFDDCAFNYYPNARIDTKQSSGIAPGDKNVFEFTSLTSAVEGIRPEVKNALIFETDPSIRTFWINGEDFKDLNVHFKRTCTCGNIAFTPAILGCIAGEQQAIGVWFMYGKATVQTPNGDEDVKFQARFDAVNF
jgi:hypothetical protein